MEMGLKYTVKLVSFAHKMPQNWHKKKEKLILDSVTSLTFNSGQFLVQLL